MSETAKNEKEMTGRQKETRVLHIMGIILMVILVIALAGAVGILTRTIIMAKMQTSGILSNGRELASTFNEYGMLGSANGFIDLSFVGVIWKVISVLGYVITIGMLAAAIVMLFLMRKRVENILSDPTALENTITVSKAKYVWLGFLLGGYGAHLFVLGKKKKGWIFLGLGLIGATIPLAFIYTSGISFADAYLAAFIPKDSMGEIDIEDYPYWI